jgi:hypothetical protein
MDVDRPVLCGMPLSAVPVKIPILMQVRWAEKTSAGDRFRVGLQFLLCPVAVQNRPRLREVS